MGWDTVCLINYTNTTIPCFSMCGKNFTSFHCKFFTKKIVYHHVKLPLVLANPSGNTVNVHLGKSQAVKVQLCHRGCAFPITPGQEQQMPRHKHLYGIAFLCQQIQFTWSFTCYLMKCDNEYSFVFLFVTWLDHPCLSWSSSCLWRVWGTSSHEGIQDLSSERRLPSHVTPLQYLPSANRRFLHGL